MAKVFALWNGGVNYRAGSAPEDTEVFDSLEQVKQELVERENGWAHIERLDGTSESTRTPVVENSEFIVWSGGDGTTTPSYGKRVYVGPRGGVRVEPYSV